MCYYNYNIYYDYGNDLIGVLILILYLFIRIIIVFFPRSQNTAAVCSGMRLVSASYFYSLQLITIQIREYIN